MNEEYKISLNLQQFIGLVSMFYPVGVASALVNLGVCSEAKTDIGTSTYNVTFRSEEQKTHFIMTYL